MQENKDDGPHGASSPSFEVNISKKAVISLESHA